MEIPAETFEEIRRVYAGRRVCVTGGAGFIGGHVVDTLVAADASVSIIDDLSNATLDNLAEHIELRPDHVRFVYGSILDDRALNEAVSGSDIVIHLAAMGSVPRSMNEPARTFEVNASGTLRVLEAARKAGAGRVVLAASSSAYGDPSTLPCAETMPTKPASPYAASKIASEQLASAWSEAFGLSTVSLRYFNVFGPRQRADSDYAAVVAAFASRLLSRERPTIFGDGLQTRDFTFVSNAVYATLPRRWHPGAAHRRGHQHRNWGVCHAHRARKGHVRDHRRRACRAGLWGPAGGRRPRQPRRYHQSESAYRLHPDRHV